MSTYSLVALGTLCCACLLITTWVVLRRRDAARTANRLVERVRATVSSARADEERAVRAELHERIQRAVLARDDHATVADAAAARMETMDGSERVFGASRRFYAAVFMIWDAAAQVAINAMTFTEGNFGGLVAGAVVWSFGPAILAAFLTSLSFRLFPRRPDHVRHVLDCTAWGLGVLAVGALMFVAFSRIAGISLGEIDDILPLAVNVLASAGGIAGGIMIAVHHNLHAEARYRTKAARAERSIRLYEDALDRLDENELLGGTHRSNAAERGRVSSMRVAHPVILAMTIMASRAQAQQGQARCLEALDWSESPVPEAMADARSRLTASLPAFLERFGCSGGLTLSRFAGDTVWFERRRFNPLAGPSLLCDTVRAAPAANQFAEVRRRTIRKAAESALQQARTSCLATVSSTAERLRLNRESIRDSAAVVLQAWAREPNARRSAIFDQIAYAVGRGIAVTVIVSDGVENIQADPPRIDIPEWQVVVLCLVPAQRDYGGAEASVRWASTLRSKIPHLVIVPYTELDADYWTRSFPLHAPTGGPPG